MIRLTQNSFFGGQLDYEMMGRQDYQRYAKGATKLVNFNIMKRGGLDKRRGFDRIMDLTTLSGVNANTKFRAIPFAYSKTRGFVLLMSATKCVIVGTNPVNQFEYYSVSNLDGVYTQTDIDSLDYQQCGDTLFLASQYHKPAKIEHVIASDGTDGFHYYVIDLSLKSNGIPSISGAKVRRLVVSDPGAGERGGTATESYEATAVYEGGETYPCSPYSSENASPYGASSWAGTNYPLPWTESQTITLSLDVPKRVDANGFYEFPSELRVYKKAFSYYGLIGTIPITTTKTRDTASITTRAGYYNEGGTDYLNDKTGNELPINGKGCKAHYFTEDTFYTMSVSGGAGTYVKMSFGCCYKSTIGDSTTSATLTFKANKATSISLFNSRNTSLVNRLALPTSSDQTKAIAREDGESTADFTTRVNAAFDDFCQTVCSSYEIKIPLNGSCAKFKVHGGTAVIYNSHRVAESAGSAVSFVDKYVTPDSSNTPPEKADDADTRFNGYGNYPASVALSQQRLVWASSINDPARIWVSEVGDFYNYDTHEIQVASDAIDFRLPITRFAKINHICEMRKLLMFNSACEWLVDSSSSMQGLTYATIQAYPQSYSGSNERLKPIICNNSLIFSERTGQAVRRFAYDITNDGFAGRDVSVLSSSIFENNNIADWTYQQFPYSTLWCVMNDGNMASFEFMEEQDIMAWMTHKLGGDGKVVCVATSYAVSPALDEVQDVDTYPYATHEEVFAVVRRQGHLWLERMRVRSRPAEDGGDMAQDTLYHSLCLDGCRVLNSDNGYTPTTETGAVWIPNDTEDGKTITRDEAIAKIAEGVDVYEGFPFDAIYESVYPNINNGNIGYGQFDIKHIQGCGLRLMHSYGGEIKPNGSSFYEPIQYFNNDPENDHRAMFVDGDVRLYNHNTNIMALPGANNRDGRVKVKQSDPYPFSVLSYEIELEPESVSYGVA